MLQVLISHTSGPAPYRDGDIVSAWLEESYVGTTYISYDGAMLKVEDAPAVWICIRIVESYLISIAHNGINVEFSFPEDIRTISVKAVNRCIDVTYSEQQSCHVMSPSEELGTFAVAALSFLLNDQLPIRLLNHVEDFWFFRELSKLQGARLLQEIRR